VFFSDKERLAYLGWLQGYCEKHDVDVLAYGLVTNHVHLIALPYRDDGLQKVFPPSDMQLHHGVKMLNSM